MTTKDILTSDVLPIFPDISDPNLAENLTRFVEFSGATDGKLQRHQMISLLYARYDNRVMFVSRPGTGKTIQAASICESFRRGNASIEPFVQKYASGHLLGVTQVIFLGRNAAILENFRRELIEKVSPDYYTPPPLLNVTKQKEFVTKRLKKFYRFYTFQNMVKVLSGNTASRDDIKEHFDSKLIVIDEAQNINAEFDQSETFAQDRAAAVADQRDDLVDEKALLEDQRTKLAQYQMIKRIMKHSTCRLIMLTATPMINDAKELKGFVNLLAGPELNRWNYENRKWNQAAREYYVPEPPMDFMISALKNKVSYIRERGSVSSSIVGSQAWGDETAVLIRKIQLEYEQQLIELRNLNLNMPGIVNVRQRQQVEVQMAYLQDAITMLKEKESHMRKMIEFIPDKWRTKREEYIAGQQLTEYDMITPLVVTDIAPTQKRATDLITGTQSFYSSERQIASYAFDYSMVNLVLCPDKEAFTDRFQGLIDYLYDLDTLESNLSIDTVISYFIQMKCLKHNYNINTLKKSLYNRGASIYLLPKTLRNTLVNIKRTFTNINTSIDELINIINNTLDITLPDDAVAYINKYWPQKSHSRNSVVKGIEEILYKDRKYRSLLTDYVYRSLVDTLFQVIYGGGRIKWMNKRHQQDYENSLSAIVEVGHRAPNMYRSAPKLTTMVKMGMFDNGVVYIVATFRWATINSLKQILRAYGYSEYRLPSKAQRRMGQQLSVKAKTFVALTSDQRGDAQSYADVINHPDNVRGDIVKFVILSEAFSEGFTLKNVGAVHIADVKWNEPRMDQAINRAFRYRSHDAWKATFPGESVKIYNHALWNGATEKDFSVDWFLYRTIEKKDMTIRKSMYRVKTSAFDQALNYEANINPNGVPYSKECDYQPTCTVGEEPRAAIRSTIQNNAYTWGAEVFSETIRDIVIESDASSISFLSLKDKLSDTGLIPNLNTGLVRELAYKAVENNKTETVTKFGLRQRMQASATGIYFSTGSEMVMPSVNNMYYSGMMVGRSTGSLKELSDTLLGTLFTGEVVATVSTTDLDAMEDQDLKSYLANATPAEFEAHIEEALVALAETGGDIIAQLSSSFYFRLLNWFYYYWNVYPDLLNHPDSNIRNDILDLTNPNKGKAAQSRGIIKYRTIPGNLLYISSYPSRRYKELDSKTEYGEITKLRNPTVVRYYNATTKEWLPKRREDYRPAEKNFFLAITTVLSKVKLNNYKNLASGHEFIVAGMQLPMTNGLIGFINRNQWKTNADDGLYKIIMSDYLLEFFRVYEPQASREQFGMKTLSVKVQDMYFMTWWLEYTRTGTLPARAETTTARDVENFRRAFEAMKKGTQISGLAQVSKLRKLEAGDFPDNIYRYLDLVVGAKDSFLNWTAKLHKEVQNEVDPERITTVRLARRLRGKFVKEFYY